MKQDTKNFHTEMPRKNTYLSLGLLSVCAMMLSGCGETIKRSIGMDHLPPDEYQVVERAPLSMPPDYQLTPPKPGAPRPQEVAAKEKAIDAVLGEKGKKQAYMATAASPSYKSKATTEVLRMAGSENTDPDIRSVIDTENRAYVKADKSFIDKIVFWQEQLPPGDVVDPIAETKRIKGNKETDKSVTDGNTPIIKRKKKAPLEGLFDN
ncbi:MAG: DUF3035 domain-containing protein [Alphaproteobacteria bacterium]|jgi:hypothetical protein|nr:DUF3035 domain-containing protein [Alphaproteobacteria bacterium]MBP9877507.1 DUF3035 domain-containing protein [Alphaproteobacteria bacterium]